MSARFPPPTFTSPAPQTSMSKGDPYVSVSDDKISVKKQPATIGGIIIGGIVITAIGVLSYFVYKLSRDNKAKDEIIEDLSKKTCEPCPQCPDLPDCPDVECPVCELPGTPSGDTVTFTKLDSLTGEISRCRGRLVNGRYVSDTCTRLGKINVANLTDNEKKARFNEFLRRLKDAKTMDQTDNIQINQEIIEEV